MSENLKKFLDLIANDKELEAKALACKEKGKEALLALAKEYGIELTEADFENKPVSGELDDDELDAVAGGLAYCNCGAAGAGGASNPTSCLLGTSNLGVTTGTQGASTCTGLGIGGGMDPFRPKADA